ncbi:hypothetical protein JCM14635_17120 [Megalodesulfovibrio paquesii]
MLSMTALVFAWAHRQAFLSSYVVNDDVRQQIAWMQQWRDPALYPDDMLTDFARHYVSYGVRGLYAAADLIVEPVLFTKILTGTLYLTMAGLLFAIGRQLAGSPTGWGLVCVYWVIPFFLQNISGGLARAFNGPLLALFCLSWMKGRGNWMAWALLLQAVFIPYMAVLSAMAAGMGWLAARLAGVAGPPFPRNMWHWLALAASAAIVWQFNHALDLAGYGPLVDRLHMADRPEFTAAGRLHILPVPSVLQEAIWGPLERLLPTSALGVAGGVLVTLLFGTVAVWGGLRAPWRCLRPHLPLLACLGGASVLLYAVARMFLMQLFVPSRYLEYSVALAHCLMLGLCLAPVMARRKVGVALVVCLALAGAGRLEGQGLYDYSRDTALYNAVQALPKNATLAGHPFLMDNVLLFGKRKVLVSFELAHPWCVGLWKRLAPRLDDFFAAYYAQDAAVVRAFASAYGVDWIVVDRRHFASEFFNWPVREIPVCQAGRFGPLRGVCEAVTNATLPLADPLPDVYAVTPPFFAPYREQIRTNVKKVRTFALLDEDEFPGIAVDAHIRLVPLGNAGELAAKHDAH